MAKKPTKKTKTTKPKEISLPTVDAKPIEDVVPAVEQATAIIDRSQSVDTPLDVKDFPIAIPMATVAFGYEARRCDVQALSGKQSGILKKVTNGLISKKATLENGRNVNKPQDAIKWILENLAEST